MGLFGNKEQARCSVCELDTGAKIFNLKDGNACEKCLRNAGYGVVGAKRKAFINVPLSEISTLCKMDDSEKSQYWNAAVAQTQQKAQQALETAAEHKDTAAAEAPVACPRCGSTQISADKKGYGVVKGAIGAVVAGPVGLAAGNIGAKKVTVTCLKCGKQWEAGK